MVREKVKKVVEYREIVYDSKRWRLLKELRREALSILEALQANGITAVVHGSIARGDVWEGSDIDVFIPYTVPSYRIEYTLESKGFIIRNRYIVVATPSSTPKAYIILDDLEKRVVSFPLAKLLPREQEFYRFGGMIGFSELLENKRVPGVDKRLVLIEPTEKGHRESPVIGREEEVASIIGVDVNTVLERVRVLSRRDKVGRTGVFIKYILSPDDSFESALEAIAKRNPWVRRVLDERG